MTPMRALTLVTVTMIAVMPIAGFLSAQDDNGPLDPSFGTAGVVTTDFANGDDAAEANVLQPDGRIIVAGHARVDDFRQFAIARYTAQGQLDPSFGSAGTGRELTAFAGTGSFGRAVALHTAGTILVAGMNTLPGDLAFATDVALVRYTPNGTLDASFGTGGTTITDVPPTEGPASQDDANAILVQPDGKIIAVGTTDDLSDGKPDFLLVRYHANGTRDSAFGTGQPDAGIVTTDFALGEDRAFAAALQANGQIVVAGVTYPTEAADGSVALARYNPDGTLDATFGVGGRVVTDFGGSTDVARAIAVRPDGSIIVAGSTGTTSGQSPTADFLLARYDSQGNLDPTFGTAGATITDVGGGADVASAMAIQPDGLIVVAGRASIDGVGRLALARYTAEGHLDPAFDGDGLVTTDVGPGSDAAHAIALQSDGRIIAAGVRGDAAADEPVDFALARYTIVVTPPPVPHTLRFFLHGTDTPGTAGAFTMNLTPGPSQTLAVDLVHAPSWLSDPTLSGTFGSAATFQLVRPCTLGLGVSATYRLSKTDGAGSAEQRLGETSRPLGLCLGEERITIPVAAPVTLTNERLRLTISSAVSVRLDLRLGPGAYLETTDFIGTP